MKYSSTGPASVGDLLYRPVLIRVMSRHEEKDARGQRVGPEDEGVRRAGAARLRRVKGAGNQALGQERDPGCDLPM